MIVDGKERMITGIDPATIAHFYTFRWAKGSEQSLGKLGTDGAIVTKDYAKDNKLAIGSSIAITMPSGTKTHAWSCAASTTPGRSCWVTSA